MTDTRSTERPDLYVVSLLHDNHESTVEGVWTTADRAVAVLRKRYPEASEWDVDHPTGSVSASVRMDSGEDRVLFWDIESFELDVSSEPWETCRSWIKDMP